MNESIEEEMKEIREDLKRIEESIEENRRMTRSLLNAHRLSTAVSVIKWVVIIGFALGAFYYIQPYLETLLKLYGNMSSLTGGVENSKGLDILNALKSF